MVNKKRNNKLIKYKLLNKKKTKKKTKNLKGSGIFFKNKSNKLNNNINNNNYNTKPISKTKKIKQMFSKIFGINKKNIAKKLVQNAIL